MPQVVPLQALPNQTAQCQLGGQACTLNVYQQAFGLYVDVLIGAQPVVQGIIGLNGNLIVRNSYFGFLGDLLFVDVQATSTTPGADPVYTGLGTRFFLVYLTPNDISELNLPAGVS